MMAEEEAANWEEEGWTRLPQMLSGFGRASWF
jgi:hypothetical protein